jgi:ribonuclease HI
MMVVYTDASVQNCGDAGIGWEIVEKESVNSPADETLATGHDVLTADVTSMQAEFLALMRGLKEALRLGERERVELYTDCQPLVGKITNHIPLTETGHYIDAFHSLLDHVENWDVSWVSREKNTVADREAHVGLDKCRQA